MEQDASSHNFHLNFFPAITKRGVSIRMLLSNESSHKERMLVHLRYLIKKFGDKFQVKLFKVCKHFFVSLVMRCFFFNRNMEPWHLFFEMPLNFGYFYIRFFFTENLLYQLNFKKCNCDLTSQSVVLFRQITWTDSKEFITNSWSQTKLDLLVCFILIFSSNVIFLNCSML